MTSWAQGWRDAHPEEYAAARERYEKLKARAAKRREAHAGEEPNQESSAAPQWMREAQFRTEAWTRD